MGFMEVGYCSEDNERREYFTPRVEFEVMLEYRDGEKSDIGLGNGQKYDCRRVE